MKRLLCLLGWHAWGHNTRWLLRSCARCGKNKRGTVVGWEDEQASRQRFFIDHAVVHDRATGRHLQGTSGDKALSVSQNAIRSHLLVFKSRLKPQVKRKVESAQKKR